MFIIFRIYQSLVFYRVYTLWLSFTYPEYFALINIKLHLTSFCPFIHPIQDDGIRIQLNYSTIFVSPMNLLISLLITISKPLIYIKNNSIPKTDPCATPLITWRHSESQQFIATLWRLWLNYAFIHPITFLSILCTLIFLRASNRVTYQMLW